MARRKHFHSAACAESEAKLAVRFGRVPRDAEHAGRERTGACVADFLKASRLPVIDRHLPQLRVAEGTRRSGDVRVLVREQTPDLKTVVQRDVNGDAERRRAGEVNGLPGQKFEEIAAEPVTAKRCNLDGLRDEVGRLAEIATRISATLNVVTRGLARCAAEGSC